MSLFATALRSFWLGPQDVKDPVLARLFGGGPTAAGISVNTESRAMAISAFWRGVRYVAETVASLPLILYKRTDKGRERFDTHPLYWLLQNKPNEYMTSMQFRETLTAHALTRGNGYAEIELNGFGRPFALWPITPDRVDPLWDENYDVVYRVTQPDGRQVYLPPSRILHVAGLGWDGLCGYSVLQVARESLGFTAATERFGAAFFGNGSSFGGALKHPRVLTDAARTHLRTSIEQAHQGVDRAHRFIILEEGMDYVRFGIPPEDAQFLETRQFQIVEIARWLGVKPHKLYDLSRATYSNIEAQMREDVTDTLRPWMKRWEAACNDKLIAPSEQRIQYFEHLDEDLLRGITSERYAAYAVAKQWGWMTTNEVRQKENLDDIGPEGDVFLTPANMLPADKLTDPNFGTPTPTPTMAPAQMPSSNGNGSQDGTARAVRRALVLDTTRRMQRIAARQRNGKLDRTLRNAYREHFTGAELETVIALFGGGSVDPAWADYFTDAILGGHHATAEAGR